MESSSLQPPSSSSSSSGKQAESQAITPTPVISGHDLALEPVGMDLQYTTCDPKRTAPTHPIAMEPPSLQPPPLPSSPSSMLHQAESQAMTLMPVTGGHDLAPESVGMDPLTPNLPVPIKEWFFLTVKSPPHNSFILTEWFAQFKPQCLIGIRLPTESKPTILSFKSESCMKQVCNILNSNNGGLYEAHETQDIASISLTTFRYTMSPTYVAEVYANHHSIHRRDELLECAPPIMELHLIDASMPGGGELRKGWKYHFLDQRKYPPVVAPHSSLDPPPHRTRLRKLQVVQFSPEWLNETIERHLISEHCSIHWY